MISALFVETDGIYFGDPTIDPWDENRDARKYKGPYPVIAHPPCQRWGKFWHGSTRKPHQYKMGDDGGCFESALSSVMEYGGVLEHPAYSHAWDFFGLRKPKTGNGWERSDIGHPTNGYWTCYVEQGHYGHISRKPTWLIANVADRPPELIWTKREQRLPKWMIDRYGYEKARRIGVVAMIGGKDKTKIRNATPLEFRDVLIKIVKAVKDI